MSILFVRASSQYAYFDLPATPTTPLVIGFKIKLTTIVDDHGAVGIYYPTAGYTGWHTRIRNSDDAAQADTATAAGAYDVSSKTGLVLSTWQTVIGLWNTSNASRQVFLDDVAGNFNSNSIVPITAQRFTLAAYLAPALGGYLDGRIAEVFQLDAIPSAGERLAFHNGSRPPDIWTSTLVRYWPLKDDVVDDVLGNTFTLVNSPTISADHPSMIDLSSSVAVMRRRIN